MYYSTAKGNWGSAIVVWTPSLGPQIRDLTVGTNVVKILQNTAEISVDKQDMAKHLNP